MTRTAVRSVLLALPTVLAAACQPALPNVERVPAPADLGERAFRHVAALVGFGARHSGSPGWDQSVDYIAAELRAIGLPPVRDRWVDPLVGLEFENVSALIPGSHTDRILLACHHDTKRCEGHPQEEHNFPFVGANDSGSGVGLLLGLARVLASERRTATVEVAFFDGEESIDFEWDVDRALFGSRRFAAQAAARMAADPRAPRIRALVLLDMVGAADLQIDEETNSTPEMHAIFRAAARACGHQDVFFRHSMAVTDDHFPFLDLGIPAIDLIDIHDNPQWHTPDDTLETISPRSLQIVGEVVLAALPAIERRWITPAAPARRR